MHPWVPPTDNVMREWGLLGAKKTFCRTMQLSLPGAECGTMDSILHDRQYYRERAHFTVPEIVIYLALGASSVIW